MKSIFSGAENGRRVDLSGTVCPMTLVKARMGLARLEAGETVEFILRGGDQVREVPKSLKEDGHWIEGICPEDGRFVLKVRKQG